MKNQQQKTVSSRDALGGKEFLKVLAAFGECFKNEWAWAGDQRRAVKLFIRVGLVPDFDPKAPRGFDALDSDDFTDLLDDYGYFTHRKMRPQRSDIVQKIRAYARKFQTTTVPPNKCWDYLKEVKG